MSSKHTAVNLKGHWCLIILYYMWAFKQQLFKYNEILFMILYFCHILYQHQGINLKLQTFE